MSPPAVGPLALLALLALPGCDGGWGAGCTNSYFPDEYAIHLDHDDWAPGTWTLEVAFDAVDAICTLEVAADTGGAADTATNSMVGACDVGEVMLIRDGAAPLTSIVLLDVQPAEVSLRITLDDEEVYAGTIHPGFEENGTKASSSCTGYGASGETTLTF